MILSVAQIQRTSQIVLYAFSLVLSNNYGVVANLPLELVTTPI